MGHRLLLPARTGATAAIYPYYYPFYPTYGYGAWYNPWTGALRPRRRVAYGPYGGAGVGARYNPRTGTYSRGAAAWGPYGARGYAEAYNPRTGTYAQTRQGSNVYGSWGSTAVQRGDDWAQTSRVTNNRTGNTTRVTQGSGGGEMVTAERARRQRRRRAHRQRRRLRRPRRQRVSPAGRQLAEVRQRIVGRCREARESTIDHRPIQLDNASDRAWRGQ